MRLCGRSPKDGDPVDREAVWEEYQALLSSAAAASGPEQAIGPPSDLQLANIKMNIIAKITWLRVRTGRDAMSLLLTSERVFADMVDWMRFGEPEQLVFRRFEPQLSLDFEFRLFVCAGQLTAISQYDHYTFFPHLHEATLRRRLEIGLREHWRLVHPHVSEMDASYVLDLAYLPLDDRFIVVELNPFSPCTGAALFSWREDRDQLEGRSGVGELCEFRLKSLAQLHPQLPEILEVNWDGRWREKRAPYWLLYPARVPWLWTWLGALTQPPETRVLLFVYGTLKRGFHWNNKYLSPRLGATFLDVAVTEDLWLLVLGDSGVPYLLPGGDARGRRVRGELWSVSEATLRGLDDYEGVSKGYYTRQSTLVSRGAESGRAERAWVYVLVAPDKDLSEREALEEYSPALHRVVYQPVRHIQRKQFAYFKAPSTWGHSAGEPVRGSTDTPSS